MPNACMPQPTAGLRHLPLQGRISTAAPGPCSQPAAQQPQLSGCAAVIFCWCEPAARAGVPSRCSAARHMQLLRTGNQNGWRPLMKGVLGLWLPSSTCMNSRCDGKGCLILGAKDSKSHKRSPIVPVEMVLCELKDQR